ncbi:MAG: PilZ domain-containing protein [Planctomycetota bacterium]
MPNEHTTDRRRHPRVTAVRACKVRPARSVRYLPAQTADVSGGGALVRLDSEHELKPGEAIEVAVAWNGEAVLPDEAVQRAIIRRVYTTGDGQQAVGVEFEMAGELPEAVAPRLAA